MARWLHSVLVLVYTIGVVATLPGIAQTPKPVATTAAPQTPKPGASRAWLAGRYDGNHVIVLFDEVKFNGTVPRTARFLSIPTTPGFLLPRELPANYVAQLPKDSDAERFRMGDSYDLLLGDGRIETVTLSTLVGYVSDDEDDDPSYIGALAKVNDPSALIGKQSYYALRRHDVTMASRRSFSSPASATLATNFGAFASLSETPVRFDMEVRLAALLTGKMNAMAKPETRRKVENLVPTLAIQAFQLAGGKQRYYARAEWREETSAGGPPAFALGAWIAPMPDLRILAVEQITSPYGFVDELPNLLNVVDLGDGCTGIIATIAGPGDSTLGLWEYRDGANLGQMRSLQKIEMDE